MKNLKKALAFLLTAAMTMAMGMSSLAAELPEGTAEAAKTITIKSPDKVGENESNTYTVYKVFDATNDGSSASISYKLMSKVTAAPDGFTVDDAGNVYLGSVSDTETKAKGEIKIKVGGEDKYLTPQETELNAAQIKAIAEYRSKVEIGTVTIKGANASKTVTVPDYGYYYITTTSGTTVSINSTNPFATVQDKNEITVVVKSAGTEYDAASLKAIAAVGSSQAFTAQITKGKGAKNVIFTDTMTNMIYNDDLKIKVGGSEVAAGDSTYTVTGAKGDSKFEVKFADAYIAGLADSTVITLNYSGTITSDALSVDPATNTAKVTSGDDNNNSSTSEEIKVYNAKFTIKKTDGTGAPLAGAGFVIANSEGKYYKLVPAAEATETTTATTAKIEWVDDITAADEHFSAIVKEADESGTETEIAIVPAFTGLANGTYTRIEKTVPAGYNKAADETFEIKDGDYTAANLEQTNTVINQAGAVLPSTGGMGTTLFYTLGSLLVIGAGVLMVTRRRMELN